MLPLFFIISTAAAAAALGASWGPGTHILLTQHLLGRLGRRRRPNRSHELVLAHPRAFLYGNIAADIINFKAYGGVKNHCHNWSIHERLESLAADDAARAFILGYLCHLAGDIVAHNHFVPFHLVHAFPPRIFGHPYWEAMADAAVSDTEWRAIDALKDDADIHRYDIMIHRAVRWRALGRRSNKWIFNNVLLINCRQSWRQVIRGVSKSARAHPLEEAFHRRCRAASLERMTAVFFPRRLALLKVEDPTGRMALSGARRLRRELLKDYGSRRAARRVASALALEAYGKL
jgi:hypothetical protein